jgi:two-component system sensor histidine kinase KdpD
MQEVVRRRSPESLLAKLKAEGQPRLHVYIGAAAGVGKTFRMLEEAHDLRRRGVDVVLALIEPHDRIDTEALVNGLEQVPLRRIEYRGATFEEIDVDDIIVRSPKLTK